MDGAPVVSRKRASKPKVRTGCLTCRRRRIKCDEGKPICRNCTHTKIHCDGYTDPTIKPRRKPQVRSKDVLPLLLPKDQVVRRIVPIEPDAHLKVASPPVVSAKWKAIELVNQLLIAEPRLSMFESEQDDRYFRVFYEKFSSLIPGYYAMSDVWGSMMLQASERDPAIRQGIIAVGALNITLETVLRRRAEASTLDAANFDTEHHKFALRRYGKAIAELRNAISSKGYSLRNVLLASLLIICFENLHGNHDAAVAQMQSCLSLLREWAVHPALISNVQATEIRALRYTGSPTSSPSSPPSPAEPISPMTEAVEGDLVRVFGRMDMQFMSFGYHRMSNDFDDTQVTSIPSCFTSIPQAQVYYERITRNIMQYLSSLFSPAERSESASAIHNPSSEPAKARAILNRQTPPPKGFTEAQHARVAAYQDLYARYETAFEPLLQSVQSLPPNDPQHLAAMAIRVWLNTARILNACALTPHQQAFDAYTKPFREIVRLSRQLLQHRRAIFTFDVGFILQLWVVGCRCRDRYVRMEAVELLLSRPWREGVWDSWLAGTMARIVLDVEEAGRTGGVLEGSARGIPERARVKAMAPKFDMLSRTGSLKCFLSGDEQRVVERELKW